MNTKKEKHSLLKAILEVLGGRPNESKFWDDTLSDETSPGIFQLLGSISFMLTWYILYAMIATFVIVFAANAAAAIYGNPDWLPGAIAQLLAGFCQSGQACEFRTIYSGFAVALIVFASMALLLGLSIQLTRRSIIDEDETFDRNDLLSLGDRLEDIRAHVQILKDALVIEPAKAELQPGETIDADTAEILTPIDPEDPSQQIYHVRYSWDETSSSAKESESAPRREAQILTGADVARRWPFLAGMIGRVKTIRFTTDIEGEVISIGLHKPMPTAFKVVAAWFFASTAALFFSLAYPALFWYAAISMMVSIIATSVVLLWHRQGKKAKKE